MRIPWQKLSSKITLTHDRLPENVQITYTPECQSAGPPGPDEGVCDNVKEKQEVDFSSHVLWHRTSKVHNNTTILSSQVQDFWNSEEKTIYLYNLFCINLEASYSVFISMHVMIYLFIYFLVQLS